MNIVELERHHSASSLLPHPRHIIGGDDSTSATAGTFEHVNPATALPQGHVPLGGTSEIDDAARAARAGFEKWIALTPEHRRDVMVRFAQLVDDRYEDFTTIAALENGLSGASMQAIRSRVLDWMRYYAGWCDKLEGSVVYHGVDGGMSYTLAEPYGVIGHIITWNAPLLSLAMKVTPSLAAGNSVIVKPAEFTPYSALLFAELGAEAGLPPGVINVVQGAGPAGDALVKHRGVDKISFTGGPFTAARIMESAAQTLTPLVFELGGKSANLIFPDANLDMVIPYSTAFALNCTGQGCALPTRMVIHKDIYDEVVTRVLDTAAMLPVGDPLDPTTFLGPVVSEAAMTRIDSVINTATADNVGELLAGGTHLENQSGFFLPATVFGDVDPASSLAQTETFGPVLSLIKFDDEDDAVRIANSTEYGLSAYIQTADITRANRLVRRLEAGTVYVNMGQPASTAALPFGGRGISGFGREGGRAGLDEFIRVKGVDSRPYPA